MRWRLWLAQSNTDRGMVALVRIMIALTGLWLLAAGYATYAMRSTLQTAQHDTKAHKKQAEDIAQDVRRKQITAVQAARLRTETPENSGSPEWADQLGRIAQQTHIGLQGVRMTADLHPFVLAVNAPNGNAPGGNGNAGNGSPPNGAPPANGSAPANGNANGQQQDSDDGWKKAQFECIALGTFRDLTAFLARLDAQPYVLEIADAEMTRERYDARTGELRLRLKLTLTLYGLPKDGKQSK